MLYVIRETQLEEKNMQQKTLFNLDTLSNKLTNIQLNLAEYLQKFHMSRQNAIVSKRLRQFGSGVEIREIVHALRVEGVPICSGAEGYYYAKDSAEIFATVKQLKSRVTSIEDAHAGLLDTYYEMKTDEIK